MSNSIYKLIRGVAPLYYSWSEAMHTRLDMVLCDLAEDHAMEIARDLQTEVRRLEKRLNRFDKNSDLHYINTHASKQPLRLDNEMWEILSHCLSLKRQTSDYFDVCIETRGGYTLNESLHTVELTSPDTRIDLGGYAKGLALEHVRRMLWTKGVENALINFGNSSVYGSGAMPFMDGGWEVSVENVGCAGTSALDIRLHYNALSTSGNTGRVSAHILSPVSGSRVEGERAVSVVCASALDSEVLSTALFAAETDEARQAILHAFDVQEAYIIDYTDHPTDPTVCVIPLPAMADPGATTDMPEFDNKQLNKIQS